jgi:hypothetical protein
MARIVELDWLRVIVFGLLIFYHTGMLYTDGWGWHYKSTYSSEFLANIMLWSNQWRMPLLFFISGASVSFLVVKLPGWQFLRERVPLLLLPLIFGMLVIVVPQVYVEANSTGVIICPNFWHFWYIYLDQHSAEFAKHKNIGSMHLEWNHLWFLPYLLAYSLIMWAAYPWLSHKKLLPLRLRFIGYTSMAGVIFLPISIFGAIGFFLYPDHSVTHNFVDDWFNHARSFFCFLCGFFLVKNSHIWQKFSEFRWGFLLSGMCTYAYCLFAFHGGSLGDHVVAKGLNNLIWSANLWLWMLCLIAWAQHLFTRTPPLLRYLNGAVFCFYVLHQTLIICFAYFLVPLKLGPVIEPVLIILLVGIFCWALYEIIRRIPVVRVLFGVQVKH